jgi:hypothetical protein
MHVPPYWAKAEHRFDPEGEHRVTAWRWSDRSTEEATAAARARVAELVAAIVAGRRPDRGDYADRPMREERLASHPEVGRDPWAIVTRNAQGSEILNTARVPFFDLDFAHLPGAGPLAALKGLLGGKRAGSEEERAVAHVERWLQRSGGARVRVYRTRAGLRLLLMDRLLDPRGPDARRLLGELGSDPLYTRLCQVQGCFRARLTPKARRVGMKRIPHEWPAAGDAERSARDRWLAEYRDRCRGFGACRFLVELGSGRVEDEAARVRELHDRAALVDPGCELA